MLCIANGNIYAVTSDKPFIGDILVDNGKIVRVGPNLKKEGMAVIDASGRNVYPGFVEAHCHLGLAGHGIGFESQDYNEVNDSVTPQLQAIDGFNPFDPTVRAAALGGVTCAGTGPGSANVLGGTFMAVKTFGTRVDEMYVKKAVAMKCAFGENPKRVYQTKDNYSRMTTAAKLRNMLKKAQEYDRKLALAKEDASKAPAYDDKLEALLPVIRGELPLKAHAHRADDIFTAIRIAKEFGVGVTIEHCTEGHLIADALAKENLPLAVGPTLTHATKFELKNKTFDTPGILAKAGCQVSIITDSPVIPLEYLPLCAGLAIKSGMDPVDALRAITINPAKHLGIADRVGSIEPGKDADIIIADGDIFESSTRVLHTLIDGREVPRD